MQSKAGAARTAVRTDAIDFSTPLSLRTAFLFPQQDARARREALVGALVLLVARTPLAL